MTFASEYDKGHGFPAPARNDVKAFQVRGLVESIRNTCRGWQIENVNQLSHGFDNGACGGVFQAR